MGNRVFPWSLIIQPSIEQLDMRWEETAPEKEEQTHGLIAPLHSPKRIKIG